MNSEAKLQLTLLASVLGVHFSAPISSIIFKAIQEIRSLREELKESQDLVQFHINNARENADDIKAVRSEFGRIKAKLQEICNECL